MSDEFETTEPVEAVEITETPTEVETSDSVDDMTDEEFVEFEKEAFKSTGSDDDEDDEESKTKTEVTESSPEELETRYKAQMDDKDAKLDQPVVVKVNGKIYEIDSVNELKNLAELGTSATSKYQAIAGHRKTIDFMQDNNLTVDDLQHLLGDRGVQPVMRTDADNAAMQVEDIATEILNGPNADNFTAAAEMLPQGVRDQMMTNPQMLKGFSEDVASGMAARVMPGVERLINVNGMDFMSAYAQEVQRLYGNQTQQKAPTETSPEPKQTPKSMLQHQPTQRAKSKSPSLSRDDINAMSEADFEKFYASV